MIWKTFLLAVLTLSLYLDLGYAEGFPATKYPFSPKLLEDKEPELCQIFLNQAKTLFRSTEPDPVLGEIKNSSIAWVKWKQVNLSRPLDPPETVYGQPEFLRADLDLEGDGGVKTVVQHIFWHSWRGKNYESYVFSSPKVFSDAVRQAKRTSPENEMQTAFAKGIQYYPSDSTGSIAFSEWDSHNLFRYKKRYYFPSAGTESDLRAGFSVIRLGGDGVLRVVCSIQMVPNEQETRAFVNLPGLNSYLKVVKAMGHAGGGSGCGTLNAEDRHDGGAEEAVMRAGFRPWAIARYLGLNREDPYYRYNSQLELFIKDWGYQDVWNHREYQTSRNHIEPALQALERYLEQAFGMIQPQAAKEARRVFEELTAAWFLVPSSGWELSPIRRAILQGDVRAIEAYLKEHPSVDEIDAEGYLLASVESLPITRLLLKAGADPNVVNRFGKTALMYAAHMNRPDVMEALLQHKADVHAVTQPIHECGIRIERSGRTALIYAAENADPTAMALLIQWGAKVDAKDSQGGDIQSYLSKNPLLATAEREMTLEKILDRYRAQQTMPSFDCNEASREVEHLICGDPVLRLHDQAMGRAYRSWSKSSTTNDSRKDQTQWLKARDQSCAGMADEAAVTCLQQWTRARVRYLHNRLDEVGSTASTAP